MTQEKRNCFFPMTEPTPVTGEIWAGNNNLGVHTWQTLADISNILERGYFDSKYRERVSTTANSRPEDEILLEFWGLDIVDDAHWCKKYSVGLGTLSESSWLLVSVNCDTVDKFFDTVPLLLYEGVNVCIRCTECRENNPEFETAFRSELVIPAIKQPKPRSFFAQVISERNVFPEWKGLVGICPGPWYDSKQKVWTQEAAIWIFTICRNFVPVGVDFSKFQGNYKCTQENYPEMKYNIFEGKYRSLCETCEFRCGDSHGFDWPIVNLTSGMNVSIVRPRKDGDVRKYEKYHDMSLGPLIRRNEQLYWLTTRHLSSVNPIHGFSKYNVRNRRKYMNGIKDAETFLRRSPFDELDVPCGKAIETHEMNLQIPTWDGYSFPVDWVLIEAPVEAENKIMVGVTYWKDTKEYDLRPCRTHVDLRHEDLSGQQVYKAGSRTGVTHGTFMTGLFIHGYSFGLPMKGKGMCDTGSVLIYNSLNSDAMFMYPGDSGAPCFVMKPDGPHPLGMCTGTIGSRLYCASPLDTLHQILDSKDPSRHVYCV